MKPVTFILLLLLAASVEVVGKPPRASGQGYSDMRTEVIDGDTVQVYNLPGVPVFSRKADMRRHDKLVRNVKKVYPIALEAERRLAGMEVEVLKIRGKARQKEYVKRMEKELMKEYTPVLKTMTFSQGKILIKLIDRQTDKTSFDIVRELRGGFQAAFWQGIARLFDANLKESYDSEGEDQEIEEIIRLYEAGLL